MFKEQLEASEQLLCHVFDFWRQVTNKGRLIYKILSSCQLLSFLPCGPYVAFQCFTKNTSCQPCSAAGCTTDTEKYRDFNFWLPLNSLYWLVATWFRIFQTVNYTGYGKIVQIEFGPSSTRAGQNTADGVLYVNIPISQRNKSPRVPS